MVMDIDAVWLGSILCMSAVHATPKKRSGATHTHSGTAQGGEAC
jgi:hypothetical protein